MLNHDRFEEDLFLPEGYKICWIRPVQLTPIHTTNKSLVTYKTDATKIENLILQFIKKQHLTKVIPAGMEIVFELSPHGQIDSGWTVFDLKRILHNYKIQELEFTPILRKQQMRIEQECGRIQEFDENEIEQLINSQENCYFITIYIPLFALTCRKAMNCDRHLANQIKDVLKQRYKQMGEKVQQQPYLITCQHCLQEINTHLPVCIALKDHRNLKLSFTNISTICKEIYPEQLKLSVRKSIDQKPRQFSYGEISKLKVQNILEMCGVEPWRWGLKVFKVKDQDVLLPFHNINVIQSSIIISNQTVEACLIRQSEYFYSLKTHFDSQEFAFQELNSKITDPSAIRECEQRGKERVSEIDGQSYKQPGFIAPIIGYTSGHFYKELNLSLQKMKFFQMEVNDIKDNWDCKFAYALIESLLLLPAYNGIVYRGANYVPGDMQKGQIITLKSFTSSSLNQTTTYKFGTRVFFTIYSLTGRDLTKFSYFPIESEILFMPFTQFQILEVVEVEHPMNGYQTRITLKEVLPAPRKRESNLLLWVDDHTTEATNIFNKLKRQYSRISTEMIQIHSNDHLKLWFERYGFYAKESSSLSVDKIKISMITDMKRGSDPEAGVQTIKLIKEYLPNVQIFVYIGNKDATQDLINYYNLNSKVQIGNRSAEVQDFIKKTVLNPDQLVKCQFCIIM